MSSIINETLLLDFVEDDWKSFYPDVFTVTDGTYPFFVSDTMLYNDCNTLRSYAIGHSAKSTTQIKFIMSKDGYIEFVHKVSSENNFDWFNISIDDSRVVHISGTTEWNTYTQELSQGEHTLSLEYAKDGSSSSNLDCGAIGYIKIEGVRPLIETKYLIKSNDKLYTLLDDGSTVTSIELTETDIASEIFRQHGFTFLPSSEILVTFINPQILYWHDNNEYELPNIHANLSFIPKSQNIITNAIDLTHSTIKGIEKVLSTYEGNPNISFSFDDKSTWKAWNGTEWVTVIGEYAGMSIEIMQSINVDQWNIMLTGANCCYMRVSLTDVDQSVEEIFIDFLN